MLALILAATIAIGPPSVIDGDTIRFGSEAVRIANIDTPEIHRAKCDAEKLLGLVAKRRLVELLSKGDVTINRGDPGSGRLKDRHGRTLATLEVAGNDIGEIMIAEGLARPWSGKRQPWCN
jgi:endonuclease YncB( thermonuclease family)